MSDKQLSWIQEAVHFIQTGFTNKLISDDKKITVYKCGSIIRIDIKD